MPFSVPENVAALIAEERPRKPISRRIARFLEQVARLRSRKALAAAVAEEVAGLRRDYALATFSSYLTDYRQAVATRFSRDHAAVSMLLSEPTAKRSGSTGFGLTAGEVRTLRNESARKVNATQRSRRLIRNPKGLLTTANTLLDSARWDDIAAGLILLTGRRMIEILKTGSFQQARPKKDGLLQNLPEGFAARFAGQVKTRNAEGTRHTPYVIPVLVRVPRLIAAHHRLRRILGNRLQERAGITLDVLPNSAVTSRFGGVVDRAVARAYGTGWNAKDLRAAYACITYHQFAPRKVADEAYYAEILGHKQIVGADEESELADAKTAAFYRQFYLPSRTTNLRLE